MIKKETQNTNIWRTFEPNEWIFIVLIILIGIMLRWIGLDDRAIHHDESLHAMYGLYIYNNPSTGYYKYNALLHGPLLYNLMPFVYDLFGTSKWAVRFLSAFLGTILIFIPFLFRRFFHKNTFLFLITCISISPSLVYWSRFIRHDYLVIMSMLLMIYGIFIADKKYAFFPILIGFTLQFTIKENAYVTLCILLGYMIFEYFLSKIFFKNNYNSFLNIIRKIKNHPASFIIAASVSIFIYCLIFSAGFKYPKGVLDGLYRESLAYWVRQHQAERISGPFIYQTLIISWYELYFMIFTLIHMILFYLKNKGIYLYTMLAAIILAIILHLGFGNQLPNIFFLYKILKIKIPIDFYAYLIVVVHAFNITIFYIKNNNRKLAFFGYLFFATWFTYSFVGEKVPWLAIYPILSGLIFLSMYLEESLILENIIALRKIKFIPVNGLFLLFVILLFTLKTSITTNFARSGMATELISQVHTTKEYENFLFKIQDMVKNPIDRVPIKVLAYHHSWPISWFLHNEPTYTHMLTNRPAEYYDYILADPTVKLNTDKLKFTHKKSSIEFRSWWLPNYKKMNWQNFLSYLFTHHPWNRTGSSYIDVYIRK